MGYDLHITRRRHWTASGAAIAASEWLSVVDADPQLELRRDAGLYLAAWRGPSRSQGLWLNWADGIISSKNPPPELIDKMVAIAKGLGAVVQGDDGEVYESGGQPPRPYKQSLAERLGAFFQRLRPMPTAAPAIPLPPFGIGDRVTDTSGNIAIVTAIDPRAMHGFGSITARYDDGRELTFTMFAHNLRPLRGTARSGDAAQQPDKPDEVRAVNGNRGPRAIPRVVRTPLPWIWGEVIESRAGKYAVVGLLTALTLVLATSRPRKARVVYSMAAVCGLATLVIALRARGAPPEPRTAPLGDPVAFIAAVPAHVGALQHWCRESAIPEPPSSDAQWGEWLWANREPLGSKWLDSAPWLVAMYGELLRKADPRLAWSVRDVEPVLAPGGRAWLGRRLFVEVHDAVFADE